MIRRVGLGRGLDALIPSEAPGRSGLRELPIDQVVVNPRQPRRALDEQALAELAASIRQLGVLQPILVRPRSEGGWEVVAGERRLRAARLAGLETVPGVVRHTPDERLLTEALVENLQRVDLNAIEEAVAYRQLIDDFGLTHDRLAERLGRSRSAVSNALRLLGLPPELQRRVADGSLSAGHARALLALDDERDQRRIAARVNAEGLSVRATEALVREAERTREPAAALSELAQRARRRHAPPYAHLAGRLADALGTRVAIRGGARRGRIIIDYSGEEDLERLLDVLGRGAGRDLAEEPVTG
ncbi:MAG: ParB/RepB/Spo0J family partition protein [Actinobacteria bacterium]|nr:ParB/RepB/Spo0J family partition protein [Actinomycetota bacterium]